MSEFITDQVRQYASVQNIVRIDQIATDLGLDRDTVQWAVAKLLDKFWLIRVGHGMYQFQSVRAKPRESEIEDRVWRAMRINSTFSASDIARQSGATMDYVYKLFRKYRAAGYIKQSGRKQTIGGGTEKIWRITPKGVDVAKAPKDAFTPDPLIEDTVSLNRLICTGMTKANEESRVLALELLGRIKARLKAEEEV